MNLPLGDAVLSTQYRLISAGAKGSHTPGINNTRCQLGQTGDISCDIMNHCKQDKRYEQPGSEIGFKERLFYFSQLHDTQ